jgi:hypothetical protein
VKASFLQKAKSILLTLSQKKAVGANIPIETERKEIQIELKRS